MELKAYLDKNRIQAADFAILSKISRASIYRFLKGEKPKKRTAWAIEKATKGEVTAEELMGNVNE